MSVLLMKLKIFTGYFLVDAHQIALDRIQIFMTQRWVDLVDLHLIESPARATPNLKR